MAFPPQGQATFIKTYQDNNQHLPTSRPLLGQAINIYDSTYNFISLSSLFQGGLNKVRIFLLICLVIWDSYFLVNFE